MTNPCIPRVASNSMSRRWTKRRDSDRKRVPRETLERMITVAVKNSDRQCEPFVGVFIEHLAPKSPEDANWAIKGIRFGRAERAKCSAVLTTVVNKMRGKFKLQHEEVGPQSLRRRAHVQADGDAGESRLTSGRIPTRRCEGALGPNYINAIASKLEHNTTRQAAISSSKPSDTKSSSPMVHLPLAMLRPNLLKISESDFVAVWVHPADER
jgi:hypothetical protein